MRPTAMLGSWKEWCRLGRACCASHPFICPMAIRRARTSMLTRSAGWTGSSTTRANACSWKSRSFSAVISMSFPPNSMPATPSGGGTTRYFCRAPGRKFAPSISSDCSTRFAPEATAPARLHFGITRRVRGRRTTGFASTICCFRRRPPIGSSPRAWTSTCAAGKNRPTTCRCGPISSSALEEAIQHVPRQLVVDPDPDDVIVEVQPLIAPKGRARRRGGIRFVLQSDVEVLDLRRPTRIELDLGAAARGPAPMPLLIGNGARGSDNAVCDIGERGAAGGIDEPVLPRVTDAPAEGREPLFPHLVPEGCIGWKLECAALFAHGGD